LLPTTTFNLGAAVTDIDPLVHLTYRVATPLEMLDQDAAPCLNNGNTATSMAPPGFSINANTGVVTWVTTAITGAFPCSYPAPIAGDLWSVQIIVEARDTNNNIVASTPVDLMMKFVTPVGALPTLTLNPIGPQTVTAGHLVTFSATGNSINPGAKVTLNATGVPVGANVTNVNTTVTPPLISNFSWTPTFSQTGTFVITYTVTDNNFQQATASETIIVAANPPTATCSADFSTRFNMPAPVGATVFDPNNEPLNVAFFLDGNPVQTFSGVVAYPTPATKSIFQTYGAVGPHVVSVVATDPHGITGKCQTNVTVTKANQAINFAALPDVTYGTPDFGITATASSGLAVDFTASGACTINGNTVHITGAGACSITASQPGDASYNAAPNVTQSFNIGKASLTVSAGSYSGVYDGASHALSACSVSANFDNLTCTNSPAGPVGPDVGSATVTPTVSGDTSNYTVNTNNGSWSITALSVTVTGGNYSGVYDGSPHAPTACASTYAGVSCSNSPASVGPDVSSGGVNPVASIVTGIAADYQIHTVDGSYSITPLAVTITGGSYSGVYDGNAHAPSACASGYPGVACANTPASVGPDVSSGPVVPVASIVTGIPADYTISPTNGSWSITPLAVSIMAGSYSGVYDGSPHAPSACGSSYPGVTCTNSPTSVGPDVSSGTVNPVPVYGSGIAADYTINPVSSSWSITPLTVSITAGSYSGVYDGNAHAPSTCSSSFGGVSCTNTPASVGPNVGSGGVTAVPQYGSLSPTNFSVQIKDGTWSITTLSVTLTAGSYSGVYDGNAHAPSACTSNFAGVTCTNNPASVGPDVGSAAVAPVVNYGSSSPSNFTVTLKNGSWSISQLAVNLTAGSYSGVYDGSAHAPSACTSSFPAGVMCTNSPASVGAPVGSGTVSPIPSYVGGIAADYQLALNNQGWSITKAPTSITLTCPASVIYTGTAQSPCTATVTGPGLNQSVPVTYTNNVVGTATATANFAGDTNRAGASATKTFQILYSTGACLGQQGHGILPPINADGTSVSKQGSTVPAKFRVCDAKGNSVGAPGTVTSFYLVQIINGTVSNVNEVPGSTTPDTAFRWSGDLWIFNISTKPLAAGATYVYQITLADGSVIPFQFGLR
jgi:hypothetical protein